MPVATFVITSNKFQPAYFHTLAQFAKYKKQPAEVFSDGSWNVTAKKTGDVNDANWRHSDVFIVNLLVSGFQ